MRGFHSVARACVLALCISGALTACKKADAPSLSPPAGTYTGTQYVSMSSPTP
jgi:major membrane immunogen (membrane-anchored lipoprotein)